MNEGGFNKWTSNMTVLSRNDGPRHAGGDSAGFNVVLYDVPRNRGTARPRSARAWANAGKES